MIPRIDTFCSANCVICASVPSQYPAACLARNGHESNRRDLSRGKTCGATCAVASAYPIGPGARTHDLFACPDGPLHHRRLTNPTSILHEIATIVPYLRAIPLQSLCLLGIAGYSIFDDLKACPSPKDRSPGMQRGALPGVSKPEARVATHRRRRSRRWTNSATELATGEGGPNCPTNP